MHIFLNVFCYIINVAVYLFFISLLNLCIFGDICNLLSDVRMISYIHFHPVSQSTTVMRWMKKDECLGL